MLDRKLFIILTIIVSISGLSQGMLLPLIAYMFERSHVPSHINGIHATSLYIGVFIASLFLESLLRKWGYRKLIITGGILVSLSLLLFPLLRMMSIWFILRLIIGIGDNMLHFSTQSWLTHVTPKHQLGRTIAVYGLSFSAGFMIGPLLARLVEINSSLPFIISAVMTFTAFILVTRLHNDFPPENEHRITLKSTLTNFSKVIKTAWIAFLFPLLFGVLESTLNSNFPVFALKHGLTLSDITWILPAFSLGSILFQVPIGSLSDRFRRSHLMFYLTLLGALTFLPADFVITKLSLMIIFFLAGIFVGSMYSLGVSYMTDITPQSLLPAGNLMCGIAFSAGSILGPVLGGLIIHATSGSYFFLMISTMIFIASLGTAYAIKKAA